MGKARSPRYPAIGLEEAIQRIEAVYKKDYQNKIPKRVVAEHMGYASLNGKSLGVISAAAKYGLLEGRADEMRVSDEALEMIAHAPGSPERVAAIKAAASKPELFAELDQKFLGGKASDSAIRSYLITQKFLPRAADIILRSYRGTKEVVAAEAAENRELACVEDGLNQGGETDSSGEFGSRGEHLKMEGSCALSSGERVVFTEEAEPKRYIKLIVSGEIDEDLLNALEAYVNRQKKRIARDKIVRLEISDGFLEEEQKRVREINGSVPPE